MERKKLRVLLTPDAEVDERPGPPSLPQVAYAPANPDGTTQMCQNCTFWHGSDENCDLHAQDVSAFSGSICNFHIFGQGLPNAWEERRGMVPLTEEQSGLRQADPIAACAACKHYRSRAKDQGSCVAVVDQDTGASAIVQAAGRCARFDDGQS